MQRRVPLGLAFLALVVGGMAGPTCALEQTLGLFLNEPGSFDGYSLFETLQYTDTFLIDNEGRLVHSWQSVHEPGLMAYLLEDGHLIRGAQAEGFGPFKGPKGAGRVQEFDWDGNLLWDFVYSNEEHRQHHDIARLPNGNVLLIAWEHKTMEEAIAAGRNPGLLWEGQLWPVHVVEVEPIGATGGNIVWEWHVWDHLIQDFDPSKENFGIVADHPELMNLNFASTGKRDWLHANAITYHEEFDQIILCFRHISEFWIIDHSTTTAEAAGHTGGDRGMGGDILYRWGNPRAYGRGTVGDQKLYRPHDAQWIEPGLPGAGNVLIYNNGQTRPEGEYSTIEEITTAVDANGDYPPLAPDAPHGPSSTVWTYTFTPPESLYSSFASGVQRQPNGNTLICEASEGTFVEVDSMENVVWLYVNPVNGDGPMFQGEEPVGNGAFRVNRYAPGYPGFDGRDLTPGDPIELDPTGLGEFLERPRFVLRQNFPNPFAPGTSIAFSLFERAPVTLEIFDVRGRAVAKLVDEALGSGEHRYAWRPGRLPNGVYYYRLRVGPREASRPMTLLR